ncbi:ankyrin repeat protein [Podospora australis]|uniref:EKC/KEOPS complex subunit BUD32 n=1 Tax=Podospora australis TaxID=1536484 RepID=A0AAN6WIK4_9PEZI|nr:ankyrin repeat protein [Podospora australis]
MLNWLANIRPAQAAQPQQHYLSIEEIRTSLHKLCMPPNGGNATRGLRISEKDVRGIRIFLQVLDGRANRIGEEGWTLRPRLYAILHRIGATNLLMDEFIRESITDFNLPFNEQTLPKFVDEKGGVGMRHAFFAVQDYYLTDAKDIESERSQHLTLSVDGDTYFVSERPLGHGSYGGVDLVFSRLSTERYARKRVLRGRGSEQAQRYLIQELRELRRLHHRHLVQIIGSYTDINYIAYLMKPVAEVTLEEFLGFQTVTRASSSYKLLLRRFYGCLSGAMNYLYAHRIRHRDLTARNILIDSAGGIYISDFGSSYNWESKPSSKTKHRNVPTSPDYMAPELAKGGEHGTKSDMFSLGIVFLEMTTWLLNLRPSEMRSKIRSHADKNNVQPYPYANLPVLTTWMEGLGNARADHDHDREPLSWIRELLHAEAQHRLTPPQLMKYIHESPSFGVFCCIACQGDFNDEGLAYGQPLPTRRDSDTKVETKHTRAAVQELFEDPMSQPFGGLSVKRTDSIKEWLEHSGPSPPSPPPLVELPDRRFDHELAEEDIAAVESAEATRFLYNAYEYEFHNPSYISHAPSSPVSGNKFASFVSVNSSDQPVEMLGDTTWQQTMTSEVKPVQKNEDDRTLNDSGLGFLEYMSHSSCSDQPLQPFEEVSDRSSLASGQEDESPKGGLEDPLNLFFGTGERRESSDRGPRDSGDVLFDEEEDKSDPEDPWEEACDEPSEGSEAEGKPEAPAAQTAVHQHNQPTIEEVTDEDAVVIQDLALDDDILIQEVVPDEDCYDTNPPVLGDGKEGVTVSIHRDALETRTEAMQVEDGGQPGEKHNASRKPIALPWIPLLSSAPQTTAPETTEGATDAKHWKDAGTRVYLDRRPLKTATKKPTKKATFSANVEFLPAAHPPTQEVPNLLPQIVVDNSFDDTTNIHHDSDHRRSSFNPRKREALVPVDVSRLMDNTWEMASSAPSSVISDTVKSRISKFFLLMPTPQQVESVLNYNCKEGSSSAVKFILAKAKKPLKKGQFFPSLCYAVKGGSSRHNKCVRELLAAGVNPNNRWQKNGLTPLHIALSHNNFKGYTNLIWLLLSNSPHAADPNAADRQGELPLAKLFLGTDSDEPLEAHKRGALIMLLKEGAKPTFKLPGTGETPLHLAVRRKDKIVTAMLLHMGAEVNAVNNSGSTPLQITANQFRREISADHMETLDHLLQNGAEVNQAAGALARTPLHWAVIAGCAQAVGRLLEAGASVTQVDKEEASSLGLALKHVEKVFASQEYGVADHIEMMTGLADKIPEAKEHLQEGKCAIETAAMQESGELLKSLLLMGLDLGKGYRDGMTVGQFIRSRGSEGARWELDRVGA